MAFDPAAREAELVAEATSWNTSSPVPAEPGDIPIVDIGPWLASGQRSDLDAAADVLRDACERVGFFQLVGHGLTGAPRQRILDAAVRFHALPVEVKERIHIDRPERRLGGVGYLPIGERRLPRRAQGNRNEAFLVKRDVDIDWDDNQWLDEDALPGFRDAVIEYAVAAEALCIELVRVYAVALDLEPDWFDEAFEQPFWRLRLTHYPPEVERHEDAFGIAPHVDTTFLTLLLQDGPGLVIYSASRDRWIEVPVVDDAFVVNTGELLKQWSNDRFLSTRHFANNDTPDARYSVPLFLNASGDYPMECLPTCCGPDNPPKYATVSYNESQAVVQGE